MITIKGVYENGEIKLLEAVPVKAGKKVLVTFIEEEDDVLRNISFQQQSPAFENYLKDSKEDLYQDYIKQ